MIAVCLLYIPADTYNNNKDLVVLRICSWTMSHTKLLLSNGMLYCLRNWIGWNIFSWALHVLCWSRQTCMKQALDNLTKVGDIHSSFHYTSQVRRGWGILVVREMKLHTCSDTWKNRVILHLLLYYFVSGYVQSALKNQYANIKIKQRIRCIMSFSLLQSAVKIALTVWLSQGTTTSRLLVHWSPYTKATTVTVRNFKETCQE